MKLYRELTQSFHIKRGDGPWQREVVPVLGLREGPWWAFLLEGRFPKLGKKITTHYVRNYTKEPYLKICDYEGPVCSFVSHVGVYNKALHDEDMKRLTKPD